jgi:hypothetical protein
MRFSFIYTARVENNFISIRERAEAGSGKETTKTKKNDKRNNEIIFFNVMSFNGVRISAKDEAAAANFHLSHFESN